MSGKEFTKKTFEKDPYYQGFVYRITNLKNGRMYIGKKTFWFKRSKKTVMSDWLSYFGSSKELLEDVKKLGRENFKREIIHICKTKAQLSYHEAKLQFQEDVLLSDHYYNKWIFVKVRKF